MAWAIALLVVALAFVGIQAWHAPQAQPTSAPVGTAGLYVPRPAYSPPMSAEQQCAARNGYWTAAGCSLLPPQTQAPANPNANSGACQQAGGRWVYTGIAASEGYCDIP